ncbi:hypothetical protein DSM112329_01029 [Paraconexibacter sp. AEG42_29]|uniref:protein-tyrosine-phosphatase n=1 Tax=Paraconexibacter sp. AEG42_29 TaxID=2997339 RepID=A0AAU7AR73_9ACTN
MIDLHCHILFGIDDGPGTAEDTVALAQAFVAAGTTTVLATPHVSFDWPANDSALIAAKVADVRALLAERTVPLDVRPGAEVALTRALELPDDELRRLTLDDSGLLLLECPLSPVAAGVEAAVAELRRRGHDRLLLAHPERVPAFQREPALLARLVEAGALTSMTAGAFSGRFGRDVARFARDLLADGLVHTVASDAHSPARRPPGIGGPLAEAGLTADAIEHLGRRAPLAALAGRPLPAAPPVMVTRRTGPLGRLLGR